MPIPNRLDQNFEQLADNLDGFIITGGDDNPLRRLVELRLAKLMTQQRKPVLGICHGAFLLTEVLGGLVSETSGHSDIEHKVLYQGTLYTVNSFHSLSIVHIPPNAQALVYDEQGLCEAWISGTVAGIVWHPERMETPWVPNQIEDLWNT